MTAPKPYLLFLIGISFLIYAHFFRKTSTGEYKGYAHHYAGILNMRAHISQREFRTKQ